MNRKIFVILMTFFITSSMFIMDGYSVQAEDNVNGSVYEYFEKQDDRSIKEQTEDKKLPPNTKTGKEDDNKQKVGVTGWDIFKTIFTLLFVVALLIGLLKWLQKKNNLSPSVQTIKNLGGTNLGGNRSVQLIKAGNSILVVGIGEDVQLLKEIQDEREIQTIIEQYNNRMDQMIKPNDIVSKLQAVWQSRKATEKREQSFKTELDKQLKDMASKRRNGLEEKLKEGFKDNE
ncbi:flagellar biosynthetic protein FliO [Bacillus andreraoultii]|uniref:flagellar biosynthetic protein FliO n=1 Tax=Bacillus andreraoultii TaxID=1499685 RepID=UPI00067F0424|nr:flagellar biosynthetic protein FliO [Bacillus andreraoultii]